MSNHSCERSQVNRITYNFETGKAKSGQGYIISKQGEYPPPMYFGRINSYYIADKSDESRYQSLTFSPRVAFDCVICCETYNNCSQIK